MHTPLSMTPGDDPTNCIGQDYCAIDGMSRPMRHSTAPRRSISNGLAVRAERPRPLVSAVPRLLSVVRHMQWKKWASRQQTGEKRANKAESDARDSYKCLVCEETCEVAACIGIATSSVGCRIIHVMSLAEPASSSLPASLVATPRQPWDNALRARRRQWVIATKCADRCGESEDVAHLSDALKPRLSP